MTVKRHIDNEKETITIEFSSGQMFGPIKHDAVTDALTKMIGNLDARVARLEDQASNN